MAELLTLPPDSKRIRARETLPVTTGEGDLRLIERGVALVELVGVYPNGTFVGVYPTLVGVCIGLKGLPKFGFEFVLVKFSTSSSNFFSNSFLVWLTLPVWAEPKLIWRLCCLGGGAGCF